MCTNPLLKLIGISLEKKNISRFNLNLDVVVCCNNLYIIISLENAGIIYFSANENKFPAFANLAGRECSNGSLEHTFPAEALCILSEYALCETSFGTLKYVRRLRQNVMKLCTFVQMLAKQ